MDDAMIKKLAPLTMSLVSAQQYGFRWHVAGTRDIELDWAIIHLLVLGSSPQGKIPMCMKSSTGAASSERTTGGWTCLRLFPPSP